MEFLNSRLPWYGHGLIGDQSLVGVLPSNSHQPDPFNRMIRTVIWRALIKSVISLLKPGLPHCVNPRRRNFLRYLGFVMALLHIAPAAINDTPGFKVTPPMHGCASFSS
jgi:hypothetical protein